jgi:hypothetical protein
MSLGVDDSIDQYCFGQLWKNVPVFFQRLATLSLSVRQWNIGSAYALSGPIPAACYFMDCECRNIFPFQMHSTVHVLAEKSG